MILSPAISPPALHGDLATRPPPSATNSLQPVSGANSSPIANNTRSHEEEEGGFAGASLRAPSVTLEAPVITHTMAATLALSLLGHVLFLKSQVPFPVVQLARMPGGQSDSRAAKRRTEFLAAIDTLSSHMHTTFAALSTALARRKGKGDNAESCAKQEHGTAYLVFVLGPSVGAARAKIVLVVDGLEVRVWGERAGAPSVTVGERGVDVANSEAHPEDSSGDESSEDEDDSGSESDSEDECSDEDTSDEESRHCGDTLSEATEPPPSPSPSPSLSGDELGHAGNDWQDATDTDRRESEPSPPVAQPPSETCRPIQTYANEQQALRAAERLLSRTLANACAEEGGGMSCELAPTQTHVLLRAPRRFSHPAWLPRQNLTRSLDGILQTFFDEAGSHATDAPKGKPKVVKKGVKTEGVYIGCCGSNVSTSMQLSRAPTHDAGDEDGEEEEDEMIWWAWDGKIVGFADW